MDSHRDSQHNHMGYPKLITAILARNEAAPDRYLKRVLERCATFSDAILVLDDSSTDNTAQIAQDFGCVVAHRDSAGFWGVAEAPARRELWERASDLAGNGWVLICDADMLLEGDPRPLTQSWDAAAWAFCLADLWDTEHTFRVDGPWGFGPTTPRPWLFKPSALCESAIWPERGIHCGHAPQNFANAGPTFAAPSDVYWLHLSYLRKEHRVAKHTAYMNVAELTPFERAHAASIAD